ncbi:hypothetical protein BDQ17DRAFT_1348466, partial [Cyathus striatus]
MTVLLLCGTGIRFDWSDSTTFSAPFKTEHYIDKIYFISPRVLDILAVVKPFVDLAIEKGVKQWVLVGGSIEQTGGHGTQAVHGYLDDKGVDHATLRATWFSDNFIAYYGDCVKTKNEIITAAEDGRIPFVASEDVAKAAFEVFTTDSKELRNATPYVLGPELHSYDERCSRAQDNTSAP